MWLNSFLLGRPGFEFQFEAGPDSMSLEVGPLASYGRNLAGDLKKAVTKTSIPVIKLNSNFLSFTQRNQFASLAGIRDSFLSFQCRDDFSEIAEQNLPTDSTHVTIQNNSATKLSAALVAAGFSGVITITSVATIPNVQAGNTFGGGGFGDIGFSGPDYFAGGSYNDQTRVVTLGSTIPDPTKSVYVTYTYKGWLVDMQKFSHSVQGGWLDRFKYDFQLTGV